MDGRPTEPRTHSTNRPGSGNLSSNGRTNLASSLAPTSTAIIHPLASPTGQEPGHAHAPYAAALRHTRHAPLALSLATATGVRHRAVSGLPHDATHSRRDPSHPEDREGHEAVTRRPCARGGRRLRPAHTPSSRVAETRPPGTRAAPPPLSAFTGPGARPRTSAAPPSALSRPGGGRTGRWHVAIHRPG